MELSADQEQARKQILSWYRSGSARKPWFLLTGSAGRGKSSCITSTVENIPGNIVYLAPTARAAMVMRRKGCPDPRTIHSAIYKPKGMGGNRKLVEMLRRLGDASGVEAEALRIQARPLIEQEIASMEAEYAAAREKLGAEARAPQKLDPYKKALQNNIQNPKQLQAVSPMFEFNPDSELIKEAALIVVDEVSMVGKKIMEDILSFKVPVLAMGDPYQLRPIQSVPFFNLSDADAHLTQIHRQSADSPIIWLAELARQGKPLPLGRHGDCLVTREALEEEAMAADQIIVGKHVTRWATNDKVRFLLGYEGSFPTKGERVMCRNNNHEKGLINGDQFTVTGCNVKQDYLWIGIENEDLTMSVKAHKEYFLRKEPNPWTKKSMECIDFSYAITCHSSQGGEWPSVYVKDESKTWGSEGPNWLYTASTRASRKLTVRL